MDITICEFCKAYVTNFEVHNCFNSGNHHRSYATIPQSSSANLAQNIDLRASQTKDYEARWSSLDQINSSMQHRFLNNIHQRTGYEENAADEIFFQYGVTNPNPYNPVTSDYMFPGTHHIQENEPNSAHLQMPSEVFIHQNSQHYGPINPEHLTNIPVSVTERSNFTGSQQTFGQRNALMHQIAQHPSALSQMECSGMSSKNELQPHFSSAYHIFGESDHTMTNRVSQYSEKSLEMPILSIKNENNPMIPTSRINSVQQTQPIPSFASLSCDFPLERPSFYMDTLCANKEESTLNRTETENLKYYTRQFSLPSTSQNFSSQEYRVNNPGVLKFKEDEYNPKNKQWADFCFGISENISYPSNASQIHEHNFGTGRSSNTEHLTWEYSCPVIHSSEGQIVCNISTTTLANQSNPTRKKHSADKIVSEYVNSTEESDTASGNTSEQSSKCDKDRTAFLPKEHRIFPGPSGTVAKPYNCSFCDKTYSIDSSLQRHVRNHTGDGLYPCTECSKSFTCCSSLRDHLRTHTGEKPFKCTKCGKCFTRSTNLRDHLRTHTGEKPFKCTKCDKCFTRSTNLRDHLRTHTGEKYACNKCSKRYIRNFDLKRHMLQHAGEERSKCDSCGAEFSSEDSLKAHKCKKNK
ncbi:hypothetical protein CDAR_193291 [Caerostris darwini]|uniref:C2H2-type domain-containing protein n=1 Tax=Caerostris darwini TaxID=1538125 RepID=A0AAV4QYQ4_9ARAC|nr:hypothetical protein CDAR_193291 [Caerostris darwini]